MKFNWLWGVIFLTSCGFQPLLVCEGDGEKFPVPIQVKPVDGKAPTTRVVHLFQRHLKNHLKHLGKAAVHLKDSTIHITLQEVGGGISYDINSSLTRGQKQLISHISLSIKGVTQEQIVSAVTSYGQTSDDSYVNRTTITQAEDRLLETLAWETARTLIAMGKK